MMTTRYRKAHVCDGGERMVVDEPGNHSACIVILYDPDIEFGFKPGASITRIEAMYMMNECAFTEGTRVLVPGHGELTVIAKPRIAKKDHWYIRQVFAGDGFILVSPASPFGCPLIKRKVRTDDILIG
jgi:hypothetical protein